jgi:hypothetical protein
MKRQLLLLVTLITLIGVSAQPFVRSTVDEQNEISSINFGDYNKDGFIDKIDVSVVRQVGVFLKIFKNNSGTFELIKKVTGSGICRFFDYDKDGDLDIIVGNDIYKNNNGSFDFVSTLGGDGTVAIGDYNKDGYPDVIAGTHLYRNLTGIQFVDNGLTLPIGSVFFDYDMDGDLDIVGGGNVYINNNGKFSLTYTVKEMTNITDICDYDKDGDLDFISNGFVFENANGLYIKKDIGITGAIKFIDVDFDGDYDIFAKKVYSRAGYYDQQVAIIYLNINNSFNANSVIDFFYNSGQYYNELYASSTAIDIDDDNDYEFFTSGLTVGGGYYYNLFKNNKYSKPSAANIVPISPTNPQSEVSGNDVILKWNKPNDANHNLPSMLNYDVRIGTTKTGKQVCAPLADLVTGFRLLPQDGLATDTLLKFKLPPGKYYWSVQSIDRQYAGSLFSSVDSFEVKTTMPPMLKTVENYSENMKRTPSFSWFKVVQAQGYNIQFSDTSSFSHIVYQSDLATDTTFVYPTLLNFDKKYFWRVATINNSEKGGYSLPFTFHTVNNYNTENISEYQTSGTCLSLLLRMENKKAIPVRCNTTNAIFGNYYEYLGLYEGRDPYASPSFSTRDYSVLSWVSNYTDPRGITLSATDYNNDNRLDYMGNYVVGSTTNYFNWNSTIPKGNKSYVWYWDNSWGRWDISGVLKNGFTPVKNGAFEWADYDNDGDKDLLITGGTDTGDLLTQLYRNNYPDTAYTKISAPFLNLIYSDAKWFDYNNDGYQDLFLSGLSEEGIVSKIYTNVNGTFTDSNAPLLGVIRGKSAVGDLDNDGILELVVTGNTGSVDTTLIYKFKNNNFVTVPSNLIGVSEGSVSLGDLDNDGTLDLALCGKHGSEYVSRIYFNKDMYFEDIKNSIKNIDLINPDNPQIALGDLDGDGDLDVLLHGTVFNEKSGKIFYAPQYLYNNTLKDGVGKQNTKPSPPTNLKVTQDKVNRKTIISWSPGSDVETKTKSLSYNIQIGTKKLGHDIVSPLADSITGDRKIMAMGNCGLDTFYIINGLKDNVYYYSVQTIDNNFEGSAFSTQDQFIYGNITVGDYISATSNPTEGGEISGTGEYNRGSIATLKITPKSMSHYIFINWTENGMVVSSSPTYSFTVSGDRNLVANFYNSPLYVSSVITTINPANSGTVINAINYEHGSNASLLATANSEYNFVNWTENGVQVSTNPSYIFTVTGFRFLVANFTSSITGFSVDSPEIVKIYSIEHNAIIEGAVGWDVKVIDINGKIIKFESSKTNRLEMSIEHSGLYLIYLTKEGQSYSKKVLVK